MIILICSVQPRLTFNFSQVSLELLGIWIRIQVHRICFLLIETKARLTTDSLTEIVKDEKYQCGKVMS